MSSRCLLHYLFIICLFSCTSSRGLSVRATKDAREIKAYIESSDILQDHFVGLRIEPLKAEAPIVQWNDEKFFTPGSNTKVWTLASALDIIGDSIPWMAIQQTDRGDVYVPMGDPSFLHPFLSQKPAIDSFFWRHFERGDTIRISLRHFQDDRYGSGWMWDDRSYYFQAEKSAFPIHGNVIKLLPDSLGVSYEPAWMTAFAGTADVSSRYREEHTNVFVLPYGQERPVFMPMKLTNQFIEDYFKAKGVVVQFLDEKWNREQSKIIYSMPRDTLLAYFMEESDNLIAEQLLLQCSMERLGYMRTEAIIDTLMKEAFQTWTDQWHWYDGSGISRYNLVTPNAMIGVLRHMINRHGLNRIKAILPAGGEGTLKNWYQYDRPRVFAKTGTVKYCHNLSGIFQAKSGQHYVFSFMHNNFTSSSNAIKEEMQSVLKLAIDTL